MMPFFGGGGLYPKRLVIQRLPFQHRATSEKDKSGLDLGILLCGVSLLGGSSRRQYWCSQCLLHLMHRGLVNQDEQVPLMPGFCQNSGEHQGYASTEKGHFGITYTREVDDNY